jgi:hypothetical protein
MSNQPTDREIISHGVELLMKTGILASDLPNWLMIEFGLTPERARDLAGKTIERLRKQRRGRLDTNPIDEPSD